MLLITNRLKLNADAKEESVLAAIDALADAEYSAKAELVNAQNALRDAQNKATADKEQAAKDLEKAKNDLTAAQNSFNDMKSKFDAMEADKKAADEAKTELEAKTMVEGFAKKGSIKNDATVILKWVNLAKADLKGTEEMLKDIPLNKAATSVITTLNPVEQETTAAYLAAKNKLLREQKNK